MRIKARLVAVIYTGLFVVMAQAAYGSQDPMAEFTKQLNGYIQIHKEAAASVPAQKVSEDPAEILKAQEAVAAAIMKARPNAKQGDIFVPAATPAFLNIIQAKLSGKQGEAARKTVLGEGNPRSPESAASVPLKVNASYPTTAPMSTVPPSLLMALPTLPEQLEFRFVGRNLILRDTKANLIVDILPNAVPEK